MRRLSVCLALGAFTAGAAAPRAALAQGYGVYEQGACTMARSGAAVASPCADGSAVFFNPAAIGQAGRRVSVGATLIAPAGSFTNSLTGEVSKLSSKVYPVPNVYFTTPVRPGWSAGIGLFAPYGLTTDWPTTAEGRFLGYHSSIKAVYVQPTLAYQLTKQLSVGAGFDFSFVSVGLKRRADLSQQLVPGGGGITFANLGVAHGTDFADIDLTGSGTGVGYHLGLLWQATDRFSLGARYLSRQLVKINNGTVTVGQVMTGLVVPAALPGLPAGTPIDAVLAPEFQTGGPLTDQSASTYLRLPDQLVLGLAYSVSPRTRVMFDYQFTNWYVFQQLPITLEKLGTVTYYLNSHATSDFRFGGEYDLSHATTLRLGVYTHGAASPSSAVIPNLPEGARTSFTGGIGANLTPKLHVDVAYQYIAQADRQGRSTDVSPAIPRAVDNNGLYTFHAHLFGATFTYAF